MGSHRRVTDQYARDYGFRIEIDPGPSSDSDGGWTNVRGGGLKAGAETKPNETPPDETPPPETPPPSPPPSPAKVPPLVLGRLMDHPSRVLADLANDVVNLGKDRRAKITLTELAKDGQPVMTYVFSDCLFVGLQLPALSRFGETRRLLEEVTFAPGSVQISLPTTSVSATTKSAKGTGTDVTTATSTTSTTNTKSGG